MRIVPVIVLAAACAPSASTDKGYDTGTGSSDASRPGPSDPDFTSTSTTAPPEQEESFLALTPAQTDAYVFVANPDRDTVTRVHVATRAVATTSVGRAPSLVLTTADYEQAVVFNAGDDSVTVIDADTLDKTTIPVRQNLNEMALSPDGRFAVLWHDQDRVDPDDPDPDGIQSFNEVSLIDLDGLVHWPMAVGFNPRMVRFTPDGRVAVIVSDELLATIDLAAPILTPELTELAPGELGAPPAEEVVLSPSGAVAWVRQFGATELLAVDLATKQVTAVPAGDNPTDLDLSPDGTQAVSVARGSHELWVFDVDDPGAPPEVVGLPTGTDYGSLVFDPTGAQALVYTTASLVERFGVWDRLAATVTERSLVKPVSSVTVTPTGESLLVFHTLEDGPESEPRFEDAWAITLVDLADFRSNPMLLPAQPLAFANSTTGERGYFVMEDSHLFEVLDYRTLLNDEYDLASVPAFLGVLPDLDPTDGDEPPAWVSQDHPLGRISFFDADDTSLETLTGFELNSQIEEQ